MQKDAFGLIYTGENNMQLRDITLSRSVAAVPFAGRYRCIDFVMSSLVNTGVSNVGLIAQRNYHSLMDHLGSGKEWDLHRKHDGLFILPPFMTKENTGIYRGTVDAIRSVMGYVRRSSQRYVILTGSHTIYNTTFNEMLDCHRDNGADITIMYDDEPDFDPSDQFDDLRLTLAENGRVTDLEINPYRPRSVHTSCDAMIMEKTLLEYLVEDAVSHALSDFTRDVLIKKVNELKLFGWHYKGYVARLNSIGSFFRHNMAVLDPDIRADLFSREHPVYTKIKDEASAYYGDTARVKNSLVADGCVVRGEVENCILFRGVRVGPNTSLKNCIVMQAVEIQENCELNYVILDKGATVRRGRRLAGYESFPVVIRKGSSV